MKVKDLKEKLEKVSEDCEVLVPSRDHSYREVWSAEAITVAKNGRDYYQWWSLEDASPGEIPVQAFVIDEG